MKTLSILRDIAAIVALAALALVLWDAHRGMVASAGELAATDKQLNATLLDVSRFTEDATGVTAEVRKTLKASQDSSRQVAANSALATQQAAAAIGALDDLVRHTDAQINGSLLPQLTAAVSQQNANLTAVAARINTSLDGLTRSEAELQPILTSVAQASAAAAKLSQDPAIEDAVKNLDATSASAASTAKHVDAATADLAAAIHRETRPASFTVKVAGWILNSAAKAGSVLAGFVK